MEDEPGRSVEDSSEWMAQAGLPERFQANDLARELRDKQEDQLHASYDDPPPPPDTWWRRLWRTVTWRQ